MARTAERLRRLENAIDSEDDAMRWCRRWKMRYRPEGGWDYRLYGCPDDDPVWLAYIESPQGKVDAAAAERYEAHPRPAVSGWMSADEMLAIVKARSAGVSVPSPLPAEVQIHPSEA